MKKKWKPWIFHWNCQGPPRYVQAGVVCMGIQMLSFPAGPTGTRGSGPLSGVKGVCHVSYCDAGRRLRIQWNTGTARSVALQLLCQSRPYKWSAFGDSCRFLYQWYIIIPLYFSHLASSYCSVQVAGRAFSRENQLGSKYFSACCGWSVSDLLDKGSWMASTSLLALTWDVGCRAWYREGNVGSTEGNRYKSSTPLLFVCTLPSRELFLRWQKWNQEYIYIYSAEFVCNAYPVDQDNW